MTFDLPTYLAATRLSGLVVGPGDRLALNAATTTRDGKGWQNEIRAVDATSGAVTRLVAPAPGQSTVGFTPAGDLLFTAKREDTEAPEDEKVGDAGSLWLLPAGGGEARRVTSAPDGIGDVAVARDAGTLVLKIDVFPAAESLEQDRALGKAREDSGTKAYLWDDYPIRFWDHPLAPREPRLFALEDGRLRDLTGAVGQSLVEQGFVVTPDGATVIAGWATPVGGGEDRMDIVTIDVASGTRTALFTAEGFAWDTPAVSPDGRFALAVKERLSEVDVTPLRELWIVELASGEQRRLAPELDRWPSEFAFTADSRAVVLSADDGGRVALFSVAIEPGAAAVPLSDEGAFAEIATSRGGDTAAVFAMRSTIGTPPEVVRLDASTVTVLHSEGFGEPGPGSLTEVSATAADGTPLRAWLMLPPGASADSPAPLVLFIHGGPLGSWNAWAWRWQPHLLAARGYAVLLPDPALSTGYGQAMVERGWGQWGGNPWDDVLALTDAALARPDLDAERTAVTGGSYGGYLTNWAITHTDRFRCAITHASIWDLTPFRGTTDGAVWWEREFGHPRGNRAFYEKWSPVTYADAIVTPTMVIHGEQDFRVPVGEGLAVYTELQRSGVPSQLLYFPDENHWVLKPGNIAVWYDAFLEWLDRWLLGTPPRRADHV